MKTKITALCVTFMLVITSFNLHANVFNVLDGEPFTLLVPNSGFIGFKWIDQGGADIINGQGGATIAANGNLTKAFTLATNTAAQTFEISVAGLDVLGGCFSDLVKHTIVVLPKLALTVTAAISNFCVDLSAISTTISASLAESITGLPTGVTLASTFKWFLDGVEQSETSGTITAVATGTYKAERVYNLPTEGTFASSGSKILNAIVGETTITKTLNVKPAVPVITLQL
jgi:hypothetical protein